MKKLVLRTLVVVAVLAMVLGTFAACCCPILDNGPDFDKIYNNLDSDIRYGWELGSDGSYLRADSNVYDLDDYSNWDIMESIEQTNKDLDLPDSLYNDMLQTTWSMGKQTETFEKQGVTVSWTYHPDKGLEVTYKKIN